MSNEIQIKFGTLELDSTNNITIGDINVKENKNIQASKIPVTDGSIAETARRISLTITVEGDIAGSNYDNLRTNLDALRAGLQNGMQKFTTDDDRYIIAQMKDFDYTLSSMRILATWRATFLAHYPFWLASRKNELSNFGFESWSAGTSVAPDGWTLGGTGSISRESSIIKLGTYSCKLTSPGANLLYNRANAFISNKGVTYWQGRTITFGCWVYATVANRAYLQLGDDSSGASSSYHTGDSTWQWLTTSHTLLASGLTQIVVDVRIEGGATSAYFDGAMCVEGESIDTDLGFDQTDTRVPTSGIGYVLTNNGNAPARVKIEVTAPGGNITDNLKIENTTTGKSLQFRGTITEYTDLEIDNRYDTDDFEVLNNGADDHANLEGDFLTLQPGNNTIVYTGTVNAIIAISWRDTYY